MHLSSMDVGTDRSSVMKTQKCSGLEHFNYLYCHIKCFGYLTLPYDGLALKPKVRWGNQWCSRTIAQILSLTYRHPCFHLISWNLFKKYIIYFKWAVRRIDINVLFSSTFYYYSRNVLQVHQHSVSKTRCSNCLKKKITLLRREGKSYHFNIQFCIYSVIIFLKLCNVPI